MKFSRLTILFVTICVLAFVGTTSVYGQESGSPSFESYDTEPTSGEKVVAPRDNETARPMKSGPHPILQLDNTDSIAVRFQSTPQKPSSSQKGQNKSKDDDDSILSFNFLYYLIERYKLQDIIE